MRNEVGVAFDGNNMYVLTLPFSQKLSRQGFQRIDKLDLAQINHLK